MAGVYIGKIMVRVFLSHSSQDKPFVRMLADELETGGEIKVWLDEREIGYGENIVLKIEEGLDANVVLLILSPDSVDSKWVKEEWTDAYWEQVNSQHTRFAGVLYRDCRSPGSWPTRITSTSGPTRPKDFARSRPGSWASVRPSRP